MPESKPKNRAEPPRVEEVDESSDESFPASDPPSWTMGKRAEFRSAARRTTECAPDRDGQGAATEDPTQAGRPRSADGVSRRTRVLCIGYAPWTHAQKSNPLIPPQASRRSVDLDIAGDDFMLQGHLRRLGDRAGVRPDLDRVSRGARDGRDQRPRRRGRRGRACSRSTAERSKRSGEGWVPRRRHVLGTARREGDGDHGRATRSVTPRSSSSPSPPRGRTRQGWHDLIANVVPFVDRAKAKTVASGPRTPGWSRRRSGRLDPAGHTVRSEYNGADEAFYLTQPLSRNDARRTDPFGGEGGALPDCTPHRRHHAPRARRRGGPAAEPPVPSVLTGVASAFRG